MAFGIRNAISAAVGCKRKLLALSNSAELDKEEDARLMGLPALRACLGSQRVRISERIFTAVGAENTPLRRARGDSKQALSWYQSQSHPTPEAIPAGF